MANENNQSQLAAATDSIPKGYSSNNPVVQDMFDGISRQQKSARGYVEAGVLGGAAGGQAAQGFTDPYAAFIQGAAAGMQVPGMLIQKKRSQLQSALDAAPLSQTMPELVYIDPTDPSKGMKPGYDVFASMPTKLAQQAIAQIGQDAIRLKTAEDVKSIKTEQEAQSYLNLYSRAMGSSIDTLGLTAKDIVGMQKSDVDNFTRIAAANRAATTKGISTPSDTQQQFTRQETEFANAYGVPATRVNPYFNMDEKILNKVQPAQIQAATKDVERATSSADTARSMQGNLERARRILDEDKIMTGPAEGFLPAWTKARQEFEQIASTLLPTMRQGMPGAVSDRDMAIFKSANISLKQDEDVNRRIIDQKLAIAQRDQEYAQFLSNYQVVHGDIAGAKAAWKGYIDRNPLFDQRGNVMPHKDFATYFSELNAGPATTVGQKAVAAGGSKMSAPVDTNYVVRELNGVKYKFDPTTKQNLGAL